MLGSVIADIVRGYRQQRAHERERRRLRDVESHPNGLLTNYAAGEMRHAAAADAGWSIFGHAERQEPFDVAVIMPTVVRPSVLDAVRSIFRQSARSIRIQLLIGVDAVQGDLEQLRALLRSSPQHVTSFLFYPGYSTSVRHGGVHPARDGGTLRSTLTYLANARYVAYLDDDNWWHEDHLRYLLDAIRGNHWAFSLRWYVHPDSREAVCEDRWESIGPGAGIYLEKFGGWVDPNCLMFDKLACEPAIRLWSIPLPGDQKAMSADRHVYDYLQRRGEPGRTGVPTVYYTLQSNDAMHSARLRFMGDAYLRAGRGVRQIVEPVGTTKRYMPPVLQLITTCKGRLHHLQRTLPRMVEVANAEVIVVDYGCEQGTAEWVRHHFPQVKLVEVRDDPGFCVARARNKGADTTSAPWLLFIDADVIIDPKFIDWFTFHADAAGFYLPSPPTMQTFGTMLCTRAAVKRVGGYDEAFRGWGGEDWDLYFRLRRAGLAERTYPGEFVKAIDHGNDERTTFYQQKSMAAHHLTSQMYFYIKWDVEAHRKSELNFEERRELMEKARFEAERFLETGSTSTTISLDENPEATRFQDWTVDRKVTYSVRARPKNLVEAASTD